MAVPSSGELRLIQDIALEVDGSASGSNISLNTLSASAGFSPPNGMLEFYGYSSSVAPSVITNSSTGIGETSMTLNGNVTTDGGDTIIERGFYFGTQSRAYIDNPKYVVGGTTGSFSLTRSGLSGGTGYYCWAFATNSKGTTFGSRVYAATIAVFYPTYAAVSTSNSNSGTRAYFSAGFLGYDYRFRSYLYYLNPNTGSWINRDYYTARPPSGYATVYWNVNQEFSKNKAIGPDLGVMATNAKNKWAVYSDQYSYPQHPFNVYSFNVSKVSPKVFSNIVIDGFTYMYNDSNTNTVAGRALMYSGNQTASPMWMSMDFNYS